MFETIVFLGIWLDTGLAYEREPPCQPMCYHDANDTDPLIGHYGAGATWAINTPWGNPIELEVGYQHDSMPQLHDAGRDQVFIRTRFWLLRR